MNHITLMSFLEKITWKTIDFAIVQLYDVIVTSPSYLATPRIANQLRLAGTYTPAKLQRNPVIPRLFTERGLKPLPPFPAMLIKSIKPDIRVNN